jgi:hypothetical protein
VIQPSKPHRTAPIIVEHEYCIDLNGTRAAIAAGYSPRSASVAAARLVKNAKVRAEIDRKLPGASFARTREKLRPQSCFSATRLRPASKRRITSSEPVNFSFSDILP